MNQDKRPSEKILERPEFSFNRSVYKSMGYSDEEMAKPNIGIANSWSELVPGSANLRQVAEKVKQGIYAAGGTPFEFGVIGCCDGTAQGNDGMHYILPSRDIIANDVEIMAKAHSLDGLVLLGSCDKIVPGLLIAAARLNLPTIFLNGGPMLGGEMFDNRPSDFTSMSEAVGMLQKNIISEEQFVDLEEACAPTVGSCSFYGTANTMCCIMEALGMSLSGSAAVPAVYADRLRYAFETGKQIVKLVEEDIKPSDILTKEAFENAITYLNATGGSTNAVMHLTAAALEAGFGAQEMMQLFDEKYKTTPLLLKINPAAPYNMEDYYHSGGVPQVLLELKEHIHQEVQTVNCLTLGQLVETFRQSFHKVDRRVIKTLDEPFSEHGGIAVLRGNLALEGCITKPSAIHESMHYFRGKAICFDSEEKAEESILSGGVHKGDIVVIRYEGPKGGPGMREMFKAMKYLYGLGLGKDTAVITDGRFSGTNNGCFVGHISPEAAEGGMIAFVEDGDEIVIDIPNNKIELLVDDEEISRRRALWQRPAYKYQKGYLAFYERMAESASRGAGIVFGKGSSNV
jgi:dihydroxy-acid dehydratase